MEEVLRAAPHIGVGAPTLVETSIVLSSRAGRGGQTALEGILSDRAIVVVPFDDQHWREAVMAFSRFGKGRHPARLNFGDCLTYATARRAGRPLLCIGDDFAQTDLDLVPLA